MISWGRFSQRDITAWMEKKMVSKDLFSLLYELSRSLTGIPHFTLLAHVTVIISSLHPDWKSFQMARYTFPNIIVIWLRLSLACIVWVLQLWGDLLQVLFLPHSWTTGIVSRLVTHLTAVCTENDLCSRLWRWQQAHFLTKMNGLRVKKRPKK